jgi:hypothetical protein
LRIIGAAADDGAVGGLRDFGVTSVSDQPEGFFAGNWLPGQLLISLVL